MRISLRPLLLTDWEAAHGWARRDDACRYQTWGPNTPAQTYAYVEIRAIAWADQPQQRFPHAMEVDGVVSGIAEMRVSAHRQGEIAYGVHPDLWGRGVATAAARDLLRLGFGELGLHRIFATCDPRNEASAAVLVKLGMTHEGRLRQNQLIRDGWRDSDVYSLLEDEWRG